jgi:hypothetical protein
MRAVRLARTITRSELTRLRWEGNVEDASALVAALVEHAVLFAVIPGAGETITLRLEVTEGRLRIDVSDPKPAFPQFTAMRELLGALWELEWFLPHEGSGKTVRAVLPCHSLRPVPLLAKDRELAPASP